jgi:beta-aspartyl-peptidase (threonine type)
MENWSIAVHGGAGPDSDHIRENLQKIEDGLRIALETGEKILQKGGSAMDAVEEAVKYFEINPLFNAGRGSSINHKGEVEMDASIMDGEKLQAGAVSMVKNVKHPIQLARFILGKTGHVMLSDNGALELAKDAKLEIEPDAYFITEHQYDAFLKERNEKHLESMMRKKIHGTVGAVARDKKGNLAAATSTGGTTNALHGRIGDSCIIGAGCYANNRICAISGTGDGEYLINGVIAHSISSAIELKNMSIQEACDWVIHEKNKDIDGDIGVIGVDPHGNIALCFNSQRMHRAWKTSNTEIQIKTY